MSPVFYDILEINIVVSILILLLCVTGRGLRRRYGAGWRKAIWLILAVRLLIPYHYSISLPEPRLFNMPVLSGNVTDLFGQNESYRKADENDSPADNAENEDISAQQPENPINVMQNVPAQDTENYGGMIAAGNENSGMEFKETKSLTDGQTPDTSHQDDGDIRSYSRTAGLTLGELLSWIWFGGFLFSLMALIVRYLFFSIRCRRSFLPVKDVELRRRIYSLQKKYLGNQRLPVRISREITSPMLTGLLNPVLLLPGKKEYGEELDYIICHELCHYKKKDLWAKMIFGLVQTVHWFNPLIYLMTGLFNYDMELACDDAVLNGQKEQKDWEAYAKLILSYAAGESASGFTTGFRGGKGQLKGRIDNMSYTGKRRKGVFLAFLLLILTLAAGILVSCGYSGGQETEDAAVDGSSGQEALSDEKSMAAQNMAGEADQEDQKQSGFAYDINHEYNSRMLYSYNGYTYISRPDGIYRLKVEDEQDELILVFQNDYAALRGMDEYRGGIYFCGSAQRGDELKSTIYRLETDTLVVTDILSAYSQSFDTLYSLSIYEDKLYVAGADLGYGVKIGFQLDETGYPVRRLDEEAEDFLYHENNLYQKQWQKTIEYQYDTPEYQQEIDALNQMYQPIQDTAHARELLNDGQVVARYKDELVESLYLETPEGEYEYLCDSMYGPVLVTETGVYYFPDEGCNIWYVDYETKTQKLIYEDSYYAGKLLANYDESYLYFTRSSLAGRDQEGYPVKNNYLMRVPREGGQAQKVYIFDSSQNLSPGGIMYRCGVDDNYIYLEDDTWISKDPARNGISPEDDKGICSDRQEIAALTDQFIEAYFAADQEKVKELATQEAYEVGEALYSHPEQAKEVMAQGELRASEVPESNVEAGTSSTLSYAFTDVGDDSYTYLTITVLKTQEGWRIQFWALEK